MALFYIQVTVSSSNIPQPTTPVPKHVRFEAVVPDDHFSMTPGEMLEVNFTAKNLASAETFTFQVLSNQSFSNGTVQPSPASLKTLQSTFCLLALMSDPDATADTVTKINVTATPASRNAEVKQLQVFSLIIAVDRELPSTTEDLEKENKLATWHIIIIAMITVLCSLLMLLLVIVLVYRMKHNR